MIENNPSNVSSGFEMLLAEVEAEIDFVKHDSPHGTWEITDGGRVRLKEGKQA